MAEKNIEVIVTLDREGNLQVNSNLNPIATAKLLTDAQNTILTEVLKKGFSFEEEETDLEDEVEEEILEN